jgi:hypothetical protein
VHAGTHGDSTTAQLQDVFVRTLKTTELKKLAIGVISGQLGNCFAPGNGLI